MELSKIPFLPMRGPEELVLKQEYRDGAIYFATDTKKIYLDANGQDKISMGGNSGIYYGIKYFSEDQDITDTQVKFSVWEIDGNTELASPIIPNVDDLILNIDGSFYRVKDVELSPSGNLDEVIIHTERLTVSGGGGSGEVVTKGRVIVTHITPSSTTILNTNKDFSLDFNIAAKDPEGQEVKEATGAGTGSCKGASCSYMINELIKKYHDTNEI